MPRLRRTRAERLRIAAVLEKRLRLARRDPSAFAEWCLRDASNRPIRQGVVHRELQQFLGEQSRALIELPRDHGKSTQVCGRIIWELGREPGLRVGVICATEALAMERGRFLREAIESNGRVRLAFPKLLPAKPWSDEAFCVERPASVIGPSVVLRGVGSALTGRRLDLLVCDDVVDAKAAASRAAREAVKRAFRDDLMNLLEPHGRLWYLCTPWHPRDLSGELKVNPAYSLFRRAVGDDLTPVWPEHWPRDRLEARRAEIGPAAFARGYRLVPQSDGESLIAPEWVRYYLDEVPPLSTVLAVDPAVGTHSRADRTAMALLGLTSSGEVRCLEAVARRWAAPEMARALAEFARRESPDVVLFEANAAFAGIADYLRDAPDLGYRLKTVVQARDKHARIAAFGIHVEQGRFRLKGAPDGGPDAGQQALFDEMAQFPLGDHDDLLDAAAFGTEFLLGRREPRVF